MRGRWIRGLALLVLICGWYGWSLISVPASRTDGEARTAVAARMMAGSRHDDDRRWLPVYPHAGGAWLPPLLVYAAAAAVHLLPAAEWTMRLPSLLIGLIDIVLIYFVALTLLRREGPALFASALLALTPSHLLFSGLAVDAVYPLPFILAWLLCLAMFLAGGRPWLLFAATACLGLGVYSQLAAVLMMPVYLGLTAVTIAVGDRARVRVYAMAALGFLWPLFPLAAWLAVHPGAYLDTVGVYGVHPAHVRNPIDGLHAVFRWHTLGVRSGVYWNYLDPVFLFGRDGVFLPPVGVLLPVGLWRTLEPPRSEMDWVLLLGFATAPIAASLVEARAVERALLLLPFAILIATIGACALWRAGEAIGAARFRRHRPR